MILKPLRLRLRRIDDELRDVQRHFSSINAALNLRRDDFTDSVRLNMLAAYEFLMQLSIMAWICSAKMVSRPYCD